MQLGIQELQLAGHRRQRRLVHGLTATTGILDGKIVLHFATNDYLGLTRHPLVLKEFRDVAEQVSGSGASPLICGRSQWHDRLEQELSRFKGTQNTVLFPTGFAANVGTLTSLIQPDDAVFCERENHASLLDGCRSGRGKFYVFDRRKLDALDQMLSKRRHQYDVVFLVTDAVFSMDGTAAPLPDLCDAANRRDAVLIVDDAHGTGVLGNNGRGLCELQKVEDRVDVCVGTLSKALGGLGGFVSGSNELCDWLWNTARSQFFSTALPPAVCAAACMALQVIRSEPERRLRLAGHAVLARRLAAELRLPVLFDDISPPESPILAILMEDDSRAVRVSRRLLNQGIFIPAVRPPTVKQGTARLRMSISSEHQPDDIARALNEIVRAIAAES